MYSTLIPGINTIMGTIGRVKQYTQNPTTSLDKFPAVIMTPTGFENTFENQLENFKMYRFNLDVIVAPSQALPIADVYATTMPNVIDDIVAAFDTNWSAGTTVDGKRIYQKIDLGEPWIVDDEADGLTVVAPLTLEIKVITVNQP